MPTGYIIKVPSHYGEWMTLTYFGQDDAILPCVYESKEQAEQYAKTYNRAKVEKYSPISEEKG